MIKIKNFNLLGTAILAGILSGLNPVSANPITASFVDDARCDAPNPPVFTEELGTDPGFATELDERISVNVYPANEVTCNAVLGGNNDWIVTMTNTTNPPRSFNDPYFVSDFLSVGNADGTINGQDAFKIDMVGINKPLLVETIAVNGVFEPNEFWEFRVSDFALPPTFGSLGLFSGDPNSNANIIASVPEPTTMLGSLLVFGSGALLKGKMKKK